MLVQQKRSPRFRWHDTQKLRTNTWNLWTHYEKYRIRKLDVPCGGKKCQLLFRESIGKKKMRNISLVLFATKTPKKKTPTTISANIYLFKSPRTLWARISTWWFSPPIWKICAFVKIGSSPQTSGWNFQKVLEVSPPTGFFFGNSGTSCPSMGPPLVFHTWDLPSEIVCKNCCRFNSTNKKKLPQKKIRPKFTKHILKIQVTTVGFN